jgi:hypothetical protein
MRRLAGARVFHPTAAHMRSRYEDIARARARPVGAKAPCNFLAILYSFDPFAVLWN